MYIKRYCGLRRSHGVVYANSDSVRRSADASTQLQRASAAAGRTWPVGFTRAPAGRRRQVHVVGADHPPPAGVPSSRQIRSRRRRPATAVRFSAPADDVIGHVLAARRRAVTRQLDLSTAVAVSSAPRYFCHHSVLCCVITTNRTFHLMKDAPLSPFNCRNTRDKCSGGRAAGQLTS